MNGTVQSTSCPRSSSDVDLSRLRDVRLNAGLSQDELAEKSGVSRSTIIKIEAGRPAWPSTARKLAQALQVRIADLRG